MRQIHFLPALFLIVAIMTACQDNISMFENEPLIISGNTVVTVNDYMKALEITKTAYSHKVIIKKDVFKTIQTRLLAQMIEELVIMKIAEEKNIQITDAEFKAEEADIKKDYPDDVFEEVLLENAIPINLWESRLRKRMLMEKVLNAEFDSKITVSPEDMKNYYDQNAKEIESDFENEQDEGEIYDRIIKRMKMDKKQAAYQAWIDRKKADYSIEVNQKIWEKILDL